MNSMLDQQTMKWIENWLNNCTQRVVIRDTKPNWMTVTSGIPGGSILGPFLFSIFWMIGYLVPSASLEMTPDWEEWPTHQKAVLPSRGFSASWRNGLTGIS